MSEMTPGEWVVGYYEDDETQGFIGESGGSICILDDLPLDRATRIAALHNRVVEMEQTRIEALEKERTCYLNALAIIVRKYGGDATEIGIEALAAAIAYNPTALAAKEKR